MIIFGWGHQTTKEHGPTIAVRCPNCNNDVWWHWISYKIWFTLFFIPVIPYESKSLLLCGTCQQGIELTEEQLEKARLLNGLTRDYIDQRIPENHYMNEIDRIKLLE